MMVLGCMLTSQSYLSIGAVSLTGDDFFFQEHRLLFNVLQENYKNGHRTDIHLISEELKRKKLLEAVGGVSYVVSLAQYVGTSAYIEEYVQGVQCKSLNRKLLSILDESIKSLILGPYDIHKALAEHQRKIENVLKGYSFNDKASIGEILSGQKSRISSIPIIKRFEERQACYKAYGKPFITGIPTGFADLDNHVTLLEDTNLIIIASRPSIGKTAFALNIAANICFDQSFPVGFISLEMRADQLVERLLSLKTGISGEFLKRGLFSDDDLKKLKQIEETIRSAKLFIHDQNCSSISQLIAKARRLKEDDAIRILIIDYVQLLNADNRSDSRHYELAEVSRKLKLLATELQIPIVCLAQLSRKVEERNDKKPLLSDLKDSGQLEQDADAVLFLHRQEYYSPNQNKGIAQILLSKNRHGPTLDATLSFNGSCGKFTDHHTHPSKKSAKALFS